MDFSLFLTKLAYPALIFLLPNERWALIYFMCGLGIAYIAYRRHAERGPDANAQEAKRKGFLRFVFPKEIWLHPSARVDYLAFVINKLITVFLLAAFLFGTEQVAQQVSLWLDAVFGPQLLTAAPPHWIWAALTTIIVAMAIDFGLWLSHYLFHKVPFLWEFHKTHHSAEVMTPFTAARAHPIDEIVSSVLSAIAGGAAYALCGRFFGPGAHVLTMFETNVITVAFFAAGFVLRHSHVWIVYPLWLQHLLISPAQHQIHHSVERKHWDRNMGFTFAIWDWMAGTLYAPRKFERLSFGIGDGSGEEKKFHSIKGLYLRPFLNIARMLRR